MEKKLEDYLHLYLGCRLTMCGSKVIVALTPTRLEIILSGYQGYKLLLRPLSDMTDEEAWESWKFLANAHNKGVTNPKYILLGNVGMDISPYQSANIVKWMLSKDFDLFGLIEAGLAIDKTKTLTTKQQ